MYSQVDPEAKRDHVFRPPLSNLGICVKDHWKEICMYSFIQIISVYYVPDKVPGPRYGEEVSHCFLHDLHDGWRFLI